MHSQIALFCKKCLILYDFWFQKLQNKPRSILGLHEGEVLEPKLSVFDFFMIFLSFNESSRMKNRYLGHYIVFDKSQILTKLGPCVDVYIFLFFSYFSTFRNS